MKNRDYWNWLEVQSDNAKKEIIENSPWYNIKDGTHVWMNKITQKRCCANINGHIYTQELSAESDEYIWAGTNYVKDYHYEKATIKEYCDYYYDNRGMAKEIEMFSPTRENYHHAMAINLFEVRKDDDTFGIPFCWQNRHKYFGRTVYIHPLWICDYKHLLFSYVDGNINYKWKPNDVFLSFEPMTETEILNM